eukprot:6192111-Pleurochrysis_carterae.AAC.3
MPAPTRCKRTDFPISYVRASMAYPSSKMLTQKRRICSRSIARTGGLHVLVRHAYAQKLARTQMPVHRDPYD